MTLLLTCVAAIVATIVWYTNEDARILKVGTLCFLYWGASIMWFVDAIFEYDELRAEYFMPAAEDMMNDAFLGLSVVVLGMIIWVVQMLCTDPKGVIRRRLHPEQS